jgi:hypothetical protein
MPQANPVDIDPAKILVAPIVALKKLILFMAYH